MFDVMSKTSILVKKIICWSLIAVLLPIICVALFWAPQYEYSGEHVSDGFTLEASIDGSDIDEAYNCKTDGQGSVFEPVEGAYIQINDLDISGSIFIINFAEPFEERTDFELFFDYGDGFDEGYLLNYHLESGEDQIYATIDSRAIKAIRLRIYRDYKIDSIDIYTTGAHIEKTYQPEAHRGIYYGLGLALALLILLIVLEIRFRLIDRLARSIPQITAIGCLKILAVIAAAAAGYFAYEMIWLGRGFDPSVQIEIFTMCITATAGFILVNIRTAAKKPELLLLFGLLAAGVAITALLPFYQAGWDIFYHFKGAIQTSSFLGAKITAADSAIIGSIYESSLFPNYEIPRDLVPKTIAELNELYDCYMDTAAFSFSISRFASGIALAVVRMLGFSFYWVYTLGKVPNFIIYAIVCYLGMKRLHSGKILYATIALFPTSIFIACNYSYDFWLTGFAMMGMAYFVGIAQEKDQKADLRDLIIMITCFMLACIPKSIYLALMLIPFFVNPKKLDNKKLYYGLCVAAIAVIVVILGVNMVINLTDRDIVSTSTGTNIVPMEQLMGVFADLPGYIVMLVRFMIGYLSPDKMERYISNMNNIGIGEFTVVFQVFIVLATLFDKGECDRRAHPVWTRLAMLILFLGTIALCASTMYLVYTDVGADEIMGCQNRYIIPVLYPGLAILTGGGIAIKKGKPALDLISMTILIATVFATIGTLMIPYYE